LSKRCATLPSIKKRATVGLIRPPAAGEERPDRRRHFTWFAETFPAAAPQPHDPAREEIDRLAKARASLKEVEERIKQQREHRPPPIVAQTLAAVLRYLFRRGWRQNVGPDIRPSVIEQSSHSSQRSPGDASPGLSAARWLKFAGETPRARERIVKTIAI
jgi:hypothetical protein